MIRLTMLLLGLILVSTLGFIFLEGLSPPEAIYLTVATITTVGYGDLIPTTPAGRWFTIVVMLGGVSSGFYALSKFGAFIVDRRFQDIMEARRMRKQLEKMTGHFVICGFGRVGRGIATELTQEHADFVIIERDSARVQAAREEGYVVLEGDATEEVVLSEAGVERARGLATAISDDAENLYITVSSHGLNASMPIVARGLDRRGERALRQAGANHVVLLDDLGASRISRSLLQPEAVDLWDDLMTPHRSTHSMGALQIPPDSPIVGKSLRDIDLRARYHIHVVAVKRAGTYLPNPDPGEHIQTGDLVVVISRDEDLTRFERDEVAPRVA